MAVGGDVHHQPGAARGLLDHPALHQPLAGPLQGPRGGDARQQQDHAAVGRAVGDHLGGGGLLQVHDHAGLGGVAPQADLQEASRRLGGGVGDGDGGQASARGGRGDQRAALPAPQTLPQTHKHLA
jgi:hypothetical protein